MNYRLLLTISILLPMIFYYLQLGFKPKTLATYFVMGIPGSIFWGVAVMVWGVLMAILYVVIHQKTNKSVMQTNLENLGE